MSVVEREPVQRLDVFERIRLAVRQGADPLVAVLDDWYGTPGVPRELWAPVVAADIRSLAVQAKSGDEPARKSLATLLLIYLPELCGGSHFALLGMVEASERQEAIE